MAQGNSAADLFAALADQVRSIKKLTPPPHMIPDGAAEELGVANEDLKKIYTLFVTRWLEVQQNNKLLKQVGPHMDGEQAEEVYDSFCLSRIVCSLVEKALQREFVIQFGHQGPYAIDANWKVWRMKEKASAVVGLAIVGNLADFEQMLNPGR